MSGPLPLLALRAFTEVGRRGSVKAAAAVLGVTPGAVSQQVKALEIRLGTVLFERRNREIRLTRPGQRLLARVGDAFGQLEDAVGSFERHRDRRRRTLTVSTVASFAATWLVPRLGRFTAAHPTIEIRIRTGAELVSIGNGPDDADLAIRHGLGQYPGLESIRLLRPRLVPVGCPAALAAGVPIREPADCLRYPLLQDADAADWSLWFQALGVGDPEGRAGGGARFADDYLLIRAAAAGQGLALVRDTYAADEIAAGRLEIALDVPWPTQFAYYVVTIPGSAARRPEIAAFRNWIAAEAKASEPRGGAVPPERRVRAIMRHASIGAALLTAPVPPPPSPSR